MCSTAKLSASHSWKTGGSCVRLSEAARFCFSGRCGAETSGTVHPSSVSMYERRQSHQWGSQSACSIGSESHGQKQTQCRPQRTFKREVEIPMGEDSER